MWIFNAINPLTVLYKLINCIKEVSNYRFYRKSISRMQSTGLLAQKEMRADWLKRVYFVVNLQPETLLAGGDLVELEQSRVTEAIASKNDVFSQDGLLEIVVADYRRIKTSDYYAYLIWIRYRTLTKIWDWVHVILWFTIAGLLISQYSYAVDFFNWLVAQYNQINK